MSLSEAAVNRIASTLLRASCQHVLLERVGVQNSKLKHPFENKIDNASFCKTSLLHCYRSRPAQNPKGL